MFIQKHQTGGLYFRLEKNDFKAAWKLFSKEVKKLKSATYNPVEKDDDNWWFVGAPDKTKFYELKKKYIDKVLMDMELDKQAGFRTLQRKRYY